MYTELDIDLARPPFQAKAPKLDWSALRQPSVRHAFVHDVAAHMPNLGQHSLQDNTWISVCNGVQQAASDNLPVLPKAPNKPWISKATLDLVAEKRSARASGDWVREKSLRER